MKRHNIFICITYIYLKNVYRYYRCYRKLYKHHFVIGITDLNRHLKRNEN